MVSNPTNWSAMVRDLGRTTLANFANGSLSGRGLYDLALDYGSAETRSAVRNLLRNRGVSEARQLARKAVSRR